MLMSNPGTNTVSAFAPLKLALALSIDIQATSCVSLTVIHINHGIELFTKYCQLAKVTSQEKGVASHTILNLPVFGQLANANVKPLKQYNLHFTNQTKVTLKVMNVCLKRKKKNISFHTYAFFKFLIVFFFFLPNHCEKPDLRLKPGSSSW